MIIFYDDLNLISEQSWGDLFVKWSVHSISGPKGDEVSMAWGQHEKAVQFEARIENGSWLWVGILQAFVSSRKFVFYDECLNYKNDDDEK